MSFIEVLGGSEFVADTPEESESFCVQDVVLFSPPRAIDQAPILFIQKILLDLAEACGRQLRDGRGAHTETLWIKVSGVL